MGETEDDAQRSARSDVVSPDELPNRESVAPGGVSDAASSNAGVDRADRPPSSGAADVKDRPSAGDVASEPDGDSPDLDELRDELNSQFESIKVLDPGKYELNLMELYDREEYIISLQEDGRYVIEVPESWRGDASPD
jgi:predicted  nucleic acid-binding Zn-ribbon protein